MDDPGAPRPGGHGAQHRHDVSGLISALYAPPGAWSHGYLWGADTLVIPRDASFSPITNRVTKSSHLLGGVEPGVADAYVLTIDSPTAVRTLNALLAADARHSWR